MTVTYRAEVGNGLIEHELVHVFGGRYEDIVRPDPREADGYDWVTPQALREDLALAPHRYSVWFRKYCAEHWDRRGRDRRVSMRSVFPFSAIVGQEEMKQALLIAAVDQAVGGVLVFGDRGTGKSTAVRALAALLPAMKVVAGCRYQCDPAGDPRAVHADCPRRRGAVR